MILTPRIAAMAECWTDERTDRLKSLAADKMTAGKIALAMGVTRNAVIGKLSRIGVPLQSGLGPTRRTIMRQPRTKSNTNAGAIVSSIKARMRDDRRSCERKTVVAISPPIVRELEARPVVSLLDLCTGMCRWPIGDPGSPGFGFCGSASVGGLPYCEGHARIAYRPPSNRSRAQMERHANG